MKDSLTLFHAAHRMSAIGIVVLFLKQIITFVKALGFVLIYAVYKYVKSEAFEAYGMQYIWLGLLLLIVLTAIVAILKFRNFKFYIDAQSELFTLEKGIFSKEKTIIQTNKIFQINLRQNFWQQALDLYSLEIETAGSSKAEVSILALSEKVAQQLKAALEQQSTPLKENEKEIIHADNSNKKQAIKIGNNNIAFAAIFSHYASGLRIAFGFVMVLWFQFQEVSGAVSEKDEYEWFQIFWDYSSMKLLIVLGVLFLLTPFFINISRFVIRYFNFAYKFINAKELNLQFGLFTLHNRIFKIQKLQEVHIASNWFLNKRKLSILSLLQSDNAGDQKQKNTLIFPGIPYTQIEKLEQAFFGQSIKKGAKIKPYINKLWFNISFRTLLWIGITFTVVNGFDVPIQSIFLFAVILIWNISIAILRFKNDALYLHPDFIIKQSGGLRKNLQIIAPHKIQDISVRRKIWRPKFGSITLHTASGFLAATWYDYNIIYGWSEYLNNTIINSDKDWM